MTNPPTAPVPYVIHDIEQNRYVKGALRSKQDPGCGSVAWVRDVAEAIHCDSKTAHEIRAIVLMVESVRGGRPEEMVRIVPAPSTEPTTAAVLGPEEIFLVYNEDVKGWYYKREVIGDRTHLSWTSDPRGAYYMNRAMAEVIADSAGLSHASIKSKVDVDALTAIAPAQSMRPMQTIRPKVKREYLLLEADHVGDMSKMVSAHLNDGWHLEGNIVVASVRARDEDLREYDHVMYYQTLTRTVPETP